MAVTGVKVFVDNVWVDVPLGSGGGGSGTPASSPPPAVGTAATGVSTDYARADHDHAIAANAITNTHVADGALAEAKVANLVTDLGAKVAKATLTAKGDIYVATASATVARLGAGANGQVLTADSAQTAGVKWADAAGGGGSSGALTAYAWNGSAYVAASGASYYVGPNDPGSVVDGSVWDQTSS